MRRDWVYLAAIAAAAFVIRLYPAWNAVFEAGGRVSFLETDAWYHVRLVENQVHNFPWRVTLDPYAAPGGQFVPIAPLYDTLTSLAVVVAYGRDAESRSIERVAALVPPALGTLAVITIWALGKHLFDRRAALLAAALLAVLPGHFMDRTMLGFVDHHALEALLSLATLLAVVCGLQTPQRLSLELAAGVALGLYLLAWGSGAFLVAILGVWLVAVILLARTSVELRAAARLMGIASATALVLVLAFQDPRMHRYGTQVIALLGLALVAAVIGGLARLDLTARRKLAIAAGLVTTVSVFVIGAWWFDPGLVRQLVIDLGRLAPDPTRMGVLEARPLFLYPGEWNWKQPWQFFRTGFYYGLAALVLFALHCWRHRRPIDLLVWMFGVATLAATIGQNRFGYYFVPAAALLSAWLATALIRWGNVADTPASWPLARMPRMRSLAALLLVAFMFAPNLSPALLLMPRTSSLAPYWEETMQWLRHQTTPPFATAAAAGDEYYLTRYSRNVAPLPDYTVMSWWDQGYWLIQRARRVPVANPTQERAPNAARFYSETNETRARSLLAADRVRFVLSDWELPFRLTPERGMMGRFQNVLDWAGATHANYYEIVYRRHTGGYAPLWVFHADYYRSMAYRLTVLGGAAAIPDNSTTVITVAERADARGRRFREVVTETTYATYEEAGAGAANGSGAMVVGLDPWRTAFPVEGLQSFMQVHGARTPEQKPSEVPWVRVFEVR